MTLSSASRRTRLSSASGLPSPIRAPDITPLALELTTRDGRSRRVDLSDVRTPALARAFAGALWADCGPGGRVGSQPTVKARTRAIRRFCNHVAETVGVATEPRELTCAMLDAFETAAMERYPAPSNMPFMLADNLLSLLRIIADDGGLDPKLAERTEWGPRAPYRDDSTLVEPYSSATAAVIRRACRRHIAEVMRRIARGNALADAGVDPTLSRDGWLRLENVLWALRERGPQAWKDLPDGAYRKLPLSLSDAHDLIFPRQRDLFPFVWFLTLDCGLEPVCAARLNTDCLQDRLAGRADIHYFKGRARGHEQKILNVADTGTFSSGGLIRVALAVTANARSHSHSPQSLWLWWAPRLGIGVGLERQRSAIDAWFIAAHGLRDEHGVLLQSIGHRRLRKTNKAYDAVHGTGNLHDDARGHDAETFGNRYARVEALRPFHENVITAGLEQALGAAIDAPVVLNPDDEQRARAGEDEVVADELGIAPSELQALLGGDTDSWLAGCRNSRSGAPNTPEGSLCRASFLGCLDCRNAVFYARKLPALIGLEARLVALCDELPEDAWNASYGHSWARLRQIFEHFTDAEIAKARSAVESGGGNLFIPPTQAA